MDLASLFVLAVGLAMDATAVSVARGATLPRVRAKHALSVAAWFGGFQAGMPALGWLLGSWIGPLVEAWDHWIAFGLLTLIGGKMLWEAIRGEEEDGDETPDRFSTRVMLVLAVATSIDSFAVGITLPMLNAPLAPALAIIGVTTAAFSAAGIYAGRALGAMLGRRLDALGGVALLALGTKILVEHLVE